MPGKVGQVDWTRDGGKYDFTPAERASSPALVTGSLQHSSMSQGEELAAQTPQKPTDHAWSATETPALSEGIGPASYIVDEDTSAELPADVTPLRLPDTEYLQLGPVLVGEELGTHGPVTATQRAIELKKENDHLSSELANLKRQVAWIQSQLEITNASLEKCTLNYKATQDQLNASRAEMMEWKDQLNVLSNLIRDNERSHLEALDELITLIERLVEHHATHRVDVLGRQPPSDTESLRQSEFQQ
jgi:hypothetical protein